MDLDEMMRVNWEEGLNEITRANLGEELDEWVLEPPHVKLSILKGQLSHLRFFILRGTNGIHFARSANVYPPRSRTGQTLEDAK